MLLLEKSLRIAIAAAHLSLLPAPSPARAAAQEDVRASGEELHPGASISVYLLTMGPGSAVWEVWGHNALWIRDTVTGLDVAYNWGMFSFEQEGFIPRLAKGTMLYWMQGFPAEGVIRSYARDDRDVWAQELNLTPAQRLELLERLRRTDTDENRYYAYDYYRDNCSTRVRDALDAVLGGRIGTALDTMATGVTWRWHARRILRGMPAAYVGMQFALGRPADRTITAWEEGFLPLRLRARLRDVTVLDADGREVPLVSGEVQLFEATRPPPPGDAPRWVPRFLAAGLSLAGVLVAAGAWAARGGRHARALAATLAAGWSLPVGTAGLLLLMAWLFTDHAFWYPNENLLQAGPLSLLLPPALLAALRSGGRGAPRWLGPLALVVLGLSVLGLLVHVVPGFSQSNGEIIALALPVHAAVAFVAVGLGRRGSGPPRS